MKKYIYGYLSVKEPNIRSYGAAKTHKMWGTCKTYYTGAEIVYCILPYSQFYVNKKECCKTFQGS